MAADPLSLTFSALAEPTRRAILLRLVDGEKTVGEIAEPFNLSRPAITKHLKVLQKAGLITQGRDAQWRPCKLNAKPLENANEWLEQYRVYWEESFDRLEEYLKTVKSEEILKGGSHDSQKECK